MPATGIFVIPATTSVSESLSPAQLIFNNLASNYHLEQLPPWTLEHQLFRETPTVGDDRDVTVTGSWLSVLHLSFDHTGQSYAAVSRPDSSKLKQISHEPPKGQSEIATKSSDASSVGPYFPATILPMPSSSAGDDLALLVVTRFGAMWERRQVAQVNGGQAFRTEDFTVRFGELRDTRAAVLGTTGGAGGTRGQLRATVAEIIYHDEDAALGRVKEIWDGLEIKGARAILDVPGIELGMAEVDEKRHRTLPFANRAPIVLDA